MTDEHFKRLFNDPEIFISLVKLERYLRGIMEQREAARCVVAPIVSERLAAYTEDSPNGTDDAEAGSTS